MDNIEIINVDNYDVGVDEVLPAVGSTTPGVSHTSLIGKDDGVQHSITAIGGLREELDEIKEPRSIESNETGVANYYLWEDGNADKTNRAGYFVTCRNREDGQVVIKICNGEPGEDVFGVTVDNAAFIGGQDAITARDYRWGLVVTDGFVDVRCDETISIGCNASPGVNGVATKCEVDYGNRVVAMRFIEDVCYAKIYLGLSPKQASDIAGDVAILKGNMESAKADISNISSDLEAFKDTVYDEMEITGGTIAGLHIAETDLSKEFTVSNKTYVAKIDSEAGGKDSPYVFGVKENDGDWKFGVKPDGKVFLSHPVVSDCTLDLGEHDKLTEEDPENPGSLRPVVDNGQSFSFYNTNGFGIKRTDNGELANETHGYWKVWNIQHSNGKDATALVPSLPDRQGIGASDHKLQDVWVNNINGKPARSADFAPNQGVYGWDKVQAGEDEGQAFSVYNTNGFGVINENGTLAHKTHGYWKLWNEEHSDGNNAIAWVPSLPDRQGIGSKHSRVLDVYTKNVFASDVKSDKFIHGEKECFEEPVLTPAPGVLEFDEPGYYTLNFVIDSRNCAVGVFYWTGPGDAPTQLPEFWYGTEERYSPRITTNGAFEVWIGSDDVTSRVTNVAITKVW